MEEPAKLEDDRRQLVPVNMIAYRSQYGSVNPAGIVGPAIVATMVSTWKR